MFRESGREGWDTAEGTEQTLTEWMRILQNDCVPQSGKTLELGCGAGDVSLLLAGKGYDAFGVDISPKAIEWAIEKAESHDLHANFRVGNVLTAFS